MMMNNHIDKAREDQGKLKIHLCMRMITINEIYMLCGVGLELHHCLYSGML